MKQVLFFGDSNTWGLIPGSHPQKRYPWGVRWTSIVAEKARESIRVIEEGLCGRTTVFEDELRPGRRGVATLPLILESHRPIDAAVLMLGTNDCKTILHASSYTIGQGIELCLQEIEKYVPSDRLLLVSPIHLGDEVWRPDKDPEFDSDSVRRSHELKDVFQKIASRHGSVFTAASDYVSASHVDEEHLDEEGHAGFAEVVFRKLQEMGVVPQ